MKIYKKPLIYAFILFMIITSSACNNKKNDNNEKIDKSSNEEKISFSKIIAINENNNKEDIYKVNTESLEFIGSIKSVMDIQYNSEKHINVYLKSIKIGSNLINNYIEINKNGYIDKINNFYSAENIKISNKGNKLAYRTFKSDSIQSAEGLNLFDIKNSKAIKIKSNVLVSGDLYQWINENEIAYYGVMPNKQNSDGFYIYDFNKRKEKKVDLNLQGYCTKFYYSTKGIIYITSSEVQNNIFYFDFKTGKNTLLKSDFESINDIAISDDKIYFIGRETNAADFELYEINNNLSIERVTFDFPKRVDKESNIQVDKDGNIYFCGYTDSVTKNSVFMYNIKDQSINLISLESKKYYLFGDKQ